MRTRKPFLGNGVTVARLALNQLVQVQILVPQLLDFLHIRLCALSFCPEVVTHEKSRAAENRHTFAQTDLLRYG